jgi:hypothetical protein
MLATSAPLKGMAQDYQARYQPPQTYHSALNAVLETQVGEVLGLSNELGNLQELTTYPYNIDGNPKKIIGSRLLDDGTSVLFLFDPAPVRPQHEIGIWDPAQKKYTTYLAGECLNFSDEHYINALFRIKAGCERLVYFTDNYNPYRVVNLDRPEYYAGTLLCDRMRFSRETYPIKVATIVQNSGGNLALGTYAFAIRYLDEDFNPTEWIIITTSTAITKDDTTTIEPGFIEGGSSNIDDIGYTPNTSKSIRLDLDTVDTRFKYVQIAVIK